MPSATTRCSSTLALLHPVWWLSLFVLLLNDHVLKGSGVVPSVVTGKLSDLAGMLVAPALVGAFWRVRSRAGFAAAHLVVGLVFASLKLDERAAALWCAMGAVLGSRWKVICDPSDLMALPMLAVSMWLFGVKLQRQRLLTVWKATVMRGAQAVGLLSVMGTSRSMPTRPILTPTSVYVGEGPRFKELDRATGRLRRVIDGNFIHRAQASIVDNVLYDAGFRGTQAYDLSASRAKWEQPLGRGSLVHADER